jgi:hypothetical protein
VFDQRLTSSFRRQGVSAGYLLKSQSSLAALYRHDPGMLEKHHSLRAFELMVHI